jgi:hypothetical protein
VGIVRARFLLRATLGPFIAALFRLLWNVALGLTHRIEVLHDTSQEHE